MVKKSLANGVFNIVLRTYGPYVCMSSSKIYRKLWINLNTKWWITHNPFKRPLERTLPDNYRKGKRGFNFGVLQEIFNEDNYVS